MERLAPLNAPEWIFTFQDRLIALGLKMDTASMFDMAVEIHSTRGTLDPIDEAQLEWDMWPPEGV